MLNQTRYLQNYTWNDLDQDIEFHLLLELFASGINEPKPVGIGPRHEPRNLGPDQTNKSEILDGN